MSFPIRILCVFSSLDRGGAETMCMNLYRNVDHNRIQFDFVKHTEKKCAYDDEIISMGGMIYVAPPYKVWNYVSYSKWWYEFLSLHPEYRIIHGHYYTISGVYFKVCKKLKRVCIGHSHTVRNQASITDMDAYIKQYHIKQVEKYSDYCLACSNAAGRYMFPHKPYVVLKNAVDSEHLAYDYARRAVMRDRLGISKDEQVIFVVANLSEVKNPLGTLDIYSAIRYRIPNARLFWVGEGGMQISMERKIETEHILGVTLLGARSDIPDLLQAADVFMLCSFSEGLPVVTIEAQASGLPCLLSSAITTEADITGLCRFLPVNQPELWADAMGESINTTRADTSEQIKAAGYDIKTTSAWLTDFYFSIGM